MNERNKKEKIAKVEIKKSKINKEGGGAETKEERKVCFFLEEGKIKTKKKKEKIQEKSKKQKKEKILYQMT